MLTQREKLRYNDWMNDFLFGRLSLLNCLFSNSSAEYNSNFVPNQNFKFVCHARLNFSFIQELCKF